ncbi:MAG: DUF4156 domain-containing protein [Pseudomonadales bacterium]|nr:DUF4156 domain-containing protein [Pseudomonadales bacterium]MCP5356701.1 DUF4156 domain-containing protein [Pseudomonadales bacterium]
MHKPLLLLSLCAAFSACSNWVNVTSAGMLVSVATPAEVTQCTRLGSANTNALSEIGFVQRGSEKLQQELIDLARNEAGDMGGNRIVVESPITEGRQSFGVYRCP